MWVLDHWEDLASDFSAVHGVRDVTQLSGPVFFALAYRMTQYPSTMREQQVRAQMEAEGASTDQPAGPQPAQAQRTVVPATKAALQADPTISRMFSFA